FEAVFFREFPTQVVVLLLLDVHAGDGVIRIVHLAFAQVAVEEPAADVVGVREVMIRRGGDGDLLRRRPRPRRRLAARQLGRGDGGGEGRGERGLDEPTAAEHERTSEGDVVKEIVWRAPGTSSTSEIAILRRLV